LRAGHTLGDFDVYTNCDIIRYSNVFRDRDIDSHCDLLTDADVECDVDFDADGECSSCRRRSENVGQCFLVLFLTFCPRYLLTGHVIGDGDVDSYRYFLCNRDLFCDVLLISHLHAHRHRYVNGHEHVVCDTL
jgi:hypothetical protein